MNKIHQRNLQYLMAEIYKTKNSLNPSFMRKFFNPRDLQYTLGNKNTLDVPKVRTTLYGIETVQFIGPKLWQMLPLNARESPSLIAFKKVLRSCTIKCDCRLRKTFISRLGFIELRYHLVCLFYPLYLLIFILIPGLN